VQVPSILAEPLWMEVRLRARSMADVLLTQPRGSAWDLGIGAAGLAVMHAHCYEAGFGEAHGQRAVDLVGEAMQGIEEKEGPLGLWTGACGVAWAAEQVNQLVCDGTDDVVADVDALLLEAVRPDRSWYNFDAVTGAVSVGIYALERLPRPAARTLLERIVAGLAATVIDVDTGVTWVARGEVADRPPHPNWQQDLGMSHGLAGVLSFLSAAYEADIEPHTCRPLIERAAARLITLRGADTPPVPPLDPLWTALTHGWCWGDLGVAVAVMRAGRALGDARIADDALAMARREATFACEDVAPDDACLCHGACGMAHMFYRCYRNSGDPALAAAAERWVAYALASATATDGISGFRFQGRDAPDADGRRERDVSFAFGPAGVVLALLAASDTHEPSWDRAFLLSSRSDA
jgi:hypothetical protein